MRSADEMAGDELTDEFSLVGCVVALMMVPTGLATVLIWEIIGHLVAEDVGFLAGFIVGTAVLMLLTFAAWKSRYRVLVIGLYVGWMLAAAVTAVAVVTPQS